VAAEWHKPSALSEFAVSGLAGHLAWQIIRVPVQFQQQPPARAELITLLDHYATVPWVKAPLDDEFNMSYGPTGAQLLRGVGQSGNGRIVITYTPAPRPDLVGVRVQSPGSPDIYLIDDDGTKRHIPDPTTYNDLFRDWSGIQAMDVSTIASGPDVTSGAYLATPPGGGPIYLVSNGQKRHVTSPAVMDKFWFNWAQVRQVPQSTLDALPNGTDLT